MMYRKRPVTIEARPFLSWMDAQALCDWIGNGAHAENTKGGLGPVALFIPTLEGEMRADIGDFIIRGVEGEFYPCKSGIFFATYEAVEGCSYCGDGEAIGVDGDGDNICADCSLPVADKPRVAGSDD